MNKKPTEGELEILQVLWKHGKATVRTVFDELSQGKEVGYTTILKLMQIMLEKGLVTRDTSTKSHLYCPLISEESTRQKMLDKLIKEMFSGSAANLVMHAIGNQKTDDAELLEIKKHLDKLLS